MNIPVKITFDRQGREVARVVADIPAEAVLDAMADVVEVMLNA